MGITILNCEPIHGLVMCKFFSELDDLGLSGHGDGFRLWAIAPNQSNSCTLEARLESVGVWVYHPFWWVRISVFIIY